jgi:hypothetical protein
LITLVVSIILGLPCCGLTLPTLIISAIALSKADTDPDSARTLVRISWIVGAALLVIAVLLSVVLIAVAVRDRSGPVVQSGGGSV